MEGRRLGLDEVHSRRLRLETAEHLRPLRRRVSAAPAVRSGFGRAAGRHAVVSERFRSQGLEQGAGEGVPRGFPVPVSGTSGDMRRGPRVGSGV